MKSHKGWLISQDQDFLKSQVFDISSNRRETKNYVFSRKIILQWQRHKKSLVFLVYRWILAIYFGTSLGYSIFDANKHGHQKVYWIYLSHLNLFVTAVAMLLGALLVTFNCCTKAENVPRKAIALYRILWNQSVMYSFLVSTFYWLFIYKDEKIDLNNFFNHIGNSAVSLIDVIIVNHPPNFWNFVYSLPAVLAYPVLTFVYQALGGLNK